MAKKKTVAERPRIARLWTELEGEQTLEDVLDDERRPRSIRQIVGFQVGTVGPT